MMMEAADGDHGERMISAYNFVCDLCLLHKAVVHQWVAKYTKAGHASLYHCAFTSVDDG